MMLQTQSEISTLHPAKNDRRSAGTVLQVIALAALALVQVPWRGYQMNVGNQGIQVAFLKALHDPHLYTNDVMVHTTLLQYPSWFFHIFANFLSIMDFQTLYVWLHLLATAGTFVAVGALSKALFKDAWAALAAALFLVAGHHQALAGETLYSTGFTHTWAVFPLTLLALVFFYRESYWAAFLLAGAIFNLHALEAGQLALLMGFVCVCSVRRIGAAKVAGLAGVFILAAAPTLAMMGRQFIDMHNAAKGGVVASQFDWEWLLRMHERSADHSFPSSWWQAGSSDIPNFLGIIGLAVVSLGFGERTVARRKTLLLGVAAAIIFIAGWVFTDVTPVAIVVRAQLFRSSRFLVVIALVVIAHGCACGWRMPFEKRRLTAPPKPDAEGDKPQDAPQDSAWLDYSREGPSNISNWRAWLEFAVACLTAATLAFPPLLVLLPVTLAIATVVALINARLAWYHALVASVAIMVSLVAWQALHVMIPGLSREVTLQSLLEFHGPSPWGWLLLAMIVGLWTASRIRIPKEVRIALSAVGILVLAIGVPVEARALLQQPPSDPAWVDVQQWAQKKTDVKALFLTPSGRSGFRIYSERSVVGEWRDGTQLYFSAMFTKPWWDRMLSLQPGLIVSADQKEVVARGKTLDQLDDEQIMALAHQYKADYVVLPHDDSRTLDRVYDNEDKFANKGWAIYKPQLAVAAASDGTDPMAQQKDFIRRVVLPGIEHNRKSEAHVQVVDARGRPIEGATYAVTQTSAGVGFGVSLPFFKVPAIDFKEDYKPPAVTQAQLAAVAGIFNYSVMPLSGQWRVLEPVEGQPRDFTDLDMYVNWCAEHDVRVEFSFLSGYQPAWMKGSNSAAQARLIVPRAKELIARYGKKIDSWEVTADKVGLDSAPAVFADLRKYADQNKMTLKLGIADDARLWSPRDPTQREADMLRGLADVRSLQNSSKTKVDFFAFDASQPTGLWADGKEMYQAFDAFAREGVKVHITQFGVPIGARIEGTVMQGRWTPELQAEYYEQFFSICYSHPNVDVVNMVALASKSWIDGEGVLDDKDDPTPALLALKKLFTEKWRTHADGTFSPDGSAAFTGFQGEYDLAVKVPSGETYHASFNVAKDQPNTYRFSLDSAAGSLKRMEGK